MRLRGEEQLLHSNIGQAVFKDHNRLVVYFRQDHISALQTGGSMSSIPTFNSILYNPLLAIFAFQRFANQL